MKTIVAACFLIPLLCSAQLKYPVTKAVDQKDNYFGVEVSDPYRWLEDDNSKEVKDWVDAQNKVTFSYLDQIPFRHQLKDKLDKLSSYARYTPPFRSGKYYYFYKNDGHQNHAPLYRQVGLTGTPELVIDPNTLSTDRTTRLMKFELSRDGKYAAYTLSKSGSDWEDIYVMDMQTLQKTDDHLKWTKVSNIAWQGDGFYYCRYSAPEKGKELVATNKNHKVYYHHLGTKQNEDQLIVEDPLHPLRFYQVMTSRDEKYVFLTIRDRDGEANNLWNRLLYKTKDEKDFKNIDNNYINGCSYIDYDGKDVYILARWYAKKGRIMKYNLQTGTLSSIVPESKDPIESVTCAGGKLFVQYLTDAHETVKVFSPDGIFENEIKLPEMGSVAGFEGCPEDKEVFYAFSSFTCPPTVFSYDITSKTSTPFWQPELRLNPDDYVTEQVFYYSNDFTKIPMFLVHKKGMTKTGANPVLLYAYGGYGISVTPVYSPHLIPFLDAGGIYVSANIRGGGEYGSDWHTFGSQKYKQKSFNDFVCAARYLIKNKYTDQAHLAIRGGSNGGLLIGAVCNQHPDLFKVAIAQAGTMDMIRFPKFTIGWNWAPEYGSPSIEEDFKVLYAYSPLHNIKSGVAYPAMLVTTADHDDRVVPAHSYKYIAALQTIASPSTHAPLLLRTDFNSGHNMSSGEKSIELSTDIYSFIFFNMGINPKL